ncbi:hypothetical protein FRX31_034421 [Thalictrum thalictroides]|uniref:Uncharacterized protein n=1 Tax=Thalictrum thalictroides TaxID=46969 RepID=A0A7J6UTQ7_THATH|nr:hypothetical protein FRX31_034421 [Thalictrum thalictroides]
MAVRVPPYAEQAGCYHISIAHFQWMNKCPRDSSSCLHTMHHFICLLFQDVGYYDNIFINPYR